eukprot:TRINITY_DN55181_c0_g1_i1.p1 TRINITY_DN55181_c0_g1~~TRINITY_DN55181_c0_g1_i1.p1  ORF type:complete len:524 (-),score=63.24 TRINITY_DN55181_c0_g1_i1:77-1567(-)
MTSDALHRTRACLAVADQASRRRMRDDWSKAFEAISASDIQGSRVEERDRHDILTFLDVLPSVSPVHTSRAHFKVRELLNGNQTWETTARDLRSLSGGPIARAFQERSTVSNRSKCSKTAVASIFVAIAFVGAVFFVLKNPAKFHLSQFQLSHVAPSDYICLLGAFPAVGLFMLLLVGFMRVVCRNLHPAAAFIVISFAVGIVVALAALTWYSLSGFSFFQHESRRLFVSTGLIHFYLWVLSNLDRLLSKIVYGPQWAYSHLKRCFFFLRLGSRVYSHAALSKELKASATAASFMKRKVGSGNPSQKPLLSGAGPASVSDWAGLLECIVHESDFRYDEVAYQLLCESQYSEKASLSNMCRFVAGYFCGVFRVVPKAFRRMLMLEDAKRGVKEAREAAKQAEQLSWQLLVDQYDWYLNHGHCFSDVLAWVVAQDERTRPVVRFLKAIDDAMSLGLMCLCQLPLFRPSPQQRSEDLARRLAIVRALAEGGSLQSNAQV